MCKNHSNASNIQVIYEDNHLLVINKRPGDIVQGDKTRDKPLSEVAKEYLKEKYNKPGAVFIGVTHRIDRPTSGILVFSKTSKALTRLNLYFSKKEIQKTYWAIVAKKPEKNCDTLTHWLKKNPKNNKSTAFKKEINGSKKAILHYSVEHKLDRYYLLKIKLETGRHHQIRCQLSHIGSPIKGDLKYGARRSNPDGSIHLHAQQIEFTHPVKKSQMKLTANPPDDKLWNTCLKSLKYEY